MTSLMKQSWNQQNHLAHQEEQPKKPEEDYYMDKLFMKDLPPTSSWMTFSGEGEYDHMEFIDWVDRLKTDFHMKDALVTSKLNIVLTGLARIWFIELRREGPYDLGRLERSYDLTGLGQKCGGIICRGLLTEIGSDQWLTQNQFNGYVSKEEDWRQQTLRSVDID